MAVFIVLVFLAGVAATLILKGWLNSLEESARARIAREKAKEESEKEAAPKRRKRQ